MDEEIQNNILDILYNNRSKGNLTDSQIQRKVSAHLSYTETVAHLNLLKDKKCIVEEKIKIPAIKNRVKYLSVSASTQKEYRISVQGIELVENNFKKKEKENATRTTFNISGGVVNFGTIQNLNFNYAEELKVLIPVSDVREEMEKYFEEIRVVASQENINKGKLGSIFKKIREKAAEKGLDKVTDKLLDVGWLYAMTQIMQFVK